MGFDKGSLIIGHWREAPIKIHWTVLLCAFLFGKFKFLPVYWVAFFFLVFIHEAGHVLIIRHYNLWTEEIVIHGLGGYCQWVGDAEDFQIYVIAWGGIFSQFIVLILAYLSIYILGPPGSSVSYQIYQAFILTNIWMMLFNLVPVEPLDGSKAWKIIDPLRKKLQGKLQVMCRKTKQKRQDKTVQKQLHKIMEVSIDEDSSGKTDSKSD